MDVSIIIVNWNTKQMLRDCLASVYEKTLEVDFEVWVVDNDSQDGSAAMVRDSFPKACLMQNTENVGFAAANNQAMKQAQGRHILLLNSDTVILDNAIDRSVRYLDEHPGVGIMGCRVLNPDRTLQRTCFRYPSLLNMLLSVTYLYKIFPNSKFFGRERMTWWGRDDEREVDVVTGCYLLVRRQVIDQIGMLDETFFMYGEETDWCYRARAQGWKVVFAPVAEIIHFGGASSRRMKPEMMLQLRAGILLFMKKNKGLPAYAVACILTSLFFLLRVPYWFCSGLFKPGNRARAMQISRVYLSGALRAWGGYECLKHK